MTARLATLHRGEVVYLASESGGNLLTLRASVGLHLPSHSTALGKCLLSQPYDALTERTLTRWRVLQRNLEEVRRSGVALSHEEYELGLDAMSVPVASTDGAGPFAAGVSLPTSRATAAVRAEIIERLRAAGRAMTA